MPAKADFSTVSVVFTTTRVSFFLLFENPLQADGMRQDSMINEEDCADL